MQRRWEVLSKEIGEAGGYFADRLSPRDLSSRFYAHRAVIRSSDSGAIEAYVALWRTRRREWYELGTVWIHPSRRGNGLRDEIMKEVVQLLPIGWRLLMVTASDGVRRSAEKFGFQMVNAGTNPGLCQWVARIGLGGRLPDSTKETGEPRFVEGVRTLFIRP